MPLSRLAWIVAYGLRPKVLYVEVPYGFNPPAGTFQFLLDACHHQAAQGLVATVKVPAGSPMLKQFIPTISEDQGAPWHAHLERTECKRCANQESACVWISNWNFALRAPCRHPEGEVSTGNLPAVDSLRAQFARQVKQILPLIRRGTKGTRDLVQETRFTQLADKLLYSDESGLVPIRKELLVSDAAVAPLGASASHAPAQVASSAN